MRFKLFEEFLNEGVNDPGILKAFFMAGGPGSGKSFVATELFGFPKGAQSSVSYATGLKLVNNDNAFEKALKDAGLDVGKIAQYAEDEEMWDNIVMPLRDKAKNLTRKMQNNYIAGRLGQVIDGTGKDFDKIKGHRKLYEDLGYDTYMVFVNTSLEVALERNRNRERKLADKMVEKMWRAVQENLGKFQKLFGRDRLLIVDNSSYDNNDILDQIEKAVMSRINAPTQNPIGRKWVTANSPQNRKRNQPFGVRESLNEGLKITAKMPSSMKRWIEGEAKNNPNSWSNELTDLANSIIGAHREYDLDLLRTDKVDPQYLNIRELPASELTSMSIDMINKVWDSMGDQAKESIYSDYQHWFKVGKKDRPLYGMYESVVNERKASIVGRYPEPDYNELMDLLDMAQEFIDTKFSSYRKGNPIEMYWSDDLVRFDDSKYRGDIAHGYDKRSAKREGVFKGRAEALYTLQKANYSPEKTKKEVEKHFGGKIGVEFAKWQGEVTGVNYIFK